MFRLYNKTKKTMYAQAKDPYAHPSENSRIWENGTKISILRDICFFDF